MIPSLNYAVLTDALNALNGGDIRYCESLGFTLDEMNALNCLSLDELFLLSRAAAHFVSVSIRHDVLHYLLAQARQEHERHEQINRAIRLGGSIALLNQYFGLTSNDVCIRRRMLGVSVPNGRTPEPDDETDAAIWRQWQKCRVQNLASPEALGAMMQITETLISPTKGLALTTVWKRITLCEQEVASWRASHAG